jgi:hypothetical protein
MNWDDLLTIKEAILLGIGGVVGYAANMLVAKQTAKKKNLILETTGRRIIVEAADACPFYLLDKQGNQLSNVYLINVRLWNKGSEHVLRSDISKESPLRVNLLDEAQVLGEPIIFRGSSDIGLQITEKSKNTYEITFECVNPGEWAEMGFFVKDKPRIRLSASGHIFGQKSDFMFHMDDGRASVGGRLTAFVAVSLVITSPIALITGLIFLFKDYSISTLFSNPDSLPWYIKSSLGLGIMVTMMSAIHYLGNWLERKRNPKTYPLDQDYKPSEAQNIGAMWGTALSGKRYGVSSSIHSRGEIIVSNQDEPSNTSINRTS